MKAFPDDATARPTAVIAMRALIKRHQRIIIFSENVENLYTYIALMMLLSDTIIICCLGYMIVTVSNTANTAIDACIA